MLSPEAAAEAAFDSFKETGELPEETKGWTREYWVKFNILLTRNRSALTEHQWKQLDGHVDSGFAKTKP